MFRNFGASGRLLGEVLQLMISDFNTFNDTQAVAGLGVYMLNASKEVRTENLTYQYGSGKTREFKPWGIYNLLNSTNTTFKTEAPYFVLEEQGTVKYNLTEGVSTTFIIWDSDASLINALDRLIRTVKELQRISASGSSDEAKMKDAVNEAASAITYFLIHINDIINGDEVIILNIIAYSEYEVDFQGGNFSGTWYVTENRQKTNRILLESVLPNYKTDYLAIANAVNDTTMQYILTYNFSAPKAPKSYTDFSFDIVQIWLKNFHVQINVEPLLKAVADANNAVQTGNQPQNPNFVLTDVFEGLDIEFYIFTHHFQNVYLYDDAKFSPLTNNPEALSYVNNNRPDALHNRTNPDFQTIQDSEITHMIQFRGADWSFKDPVISSNGVSWGIRGDNVQLRVIPVGIKPDDVNETVAPIENMTYYELGFTFNPIKREKVETGDYITGSSRDVTLGHAKVKFDQAFGRWNNGNGPSTPAMAENKLDLTTLFMSTILHVHLKIDNSKKTTTTTTSSPEDQNATVKGVMNEDNYDNVTKAVYVGDVAGELPLASIEIAGEDYVKKVGTTSETLPATSNIIPTLYADVDSFSTQTYEQADNSTGQMNTTLNIDFSVLLYAVAYPQFDSSGAEIVHDPTYSIFIKFENPGLWAVILVIGVVSLVGIAAMFITKKKNAALGI